MSPTGGGAVDGGAGGGGDTTAWGSASTSTSTCAAVNASASASCAPAPTKRGTSLLERIDCPPPRWFPHPQHCLRPRHAIDNTELIRLTHARALLERWSDSRRKSTCSTSCGMSSRRLMAITTPSNFRVGKSSNRADSAFHSTLKSSMLVNANNSTKATWPLLQSSILCSDKSHQPIGQRRATITPNTQKEDTEA